LLSLQLSQVYWRCSFKRLRALPNAQLKTQTAPKAQGRGCSY
jgi:hypothetical protein